MGNLIPRWLTVSMLTLNALSTWPARACLSTSFLHSTVRSYLFKNALLPWWCSTVTKIPCSSNFSREGSRCLGLEFVHQDQGLFAVMHHCLLLHTWWMGYNVLEKAMMGLLIGRVTGWSESIKPIQEYILPKWMLHLSLIENLYWEEMSWRQPAKVGVIIICHLAQPLPLFSLLKQP